MNLVRFILRASCPTVLLASLVISHDEQYFHVADRVRKLVEGKLHEAGALYACTEGPAA